MGEGLKRVEQGAKEVWPYLKWALLVLAIPGLYYLGYWLLVTVPEQQVSGWLIKDEAVSPKDRAHIVIEARRTGVQILGGLLAIAGAIFAFYLHHRRVTAMEEQVRVAQEGQVTERFTRAIEHLGDDRLEVRLGGIYALERIARDSEKDHWTIMEVLTAYVRERASWKEAPAPPSTSGVEAEPPAEPGPSRPKPPLDIQAILTVIGRRARFFGQGETEPLDLRGTDLRGADLTGAHLERADLVEAHLERANLWGTHLERAVLVEAHLEGAILREAHLKAADLVGAHLERAVLGGAHLEGAHLRKAHLEGAILVGAHLEGANLAGAHMEGAKLMGARLEGANLSGVKGLTREQLAQACTDDKTILPDYFKEPGGGAPQAEE